MTGAVQVIHGDSRDVLKTIADCSVDSVVCDPPYALVSIVKRFGSADAAAVKPGNVYARASAGFMGQAWDTGETAFDPDFWREVLRVLKPGGHIVAFGGSRSYGRLQLAIEDAGFEVRDSLLNAISTNAAVAAFIASLDDEQRRAFARCIDDSQFGGLLAWVFGSGFPKSHDTERAAALATCPLPGRHFARQLPQVADQLAGDHVCAVTPQSAPWMGWGTALKPAFEPIVLARRPLSENTVAANVLRWGTGALNIDACRVDVADEKIGAGSKNLSSWRRAEGRSDLPDKPAASREEGLGRWPANLIHDGSAEVLAAFPDASGMSSGGRRDGLAPTERVAMGAIGNQGESVARRDSGSAARFFYSPKADGGERLGTRHPTVKPVDPMRWLIRLVTPANGLVLDPFAGSGTTGIAAIAEGMRAVLIEREDQYVADIRRRLAWVEGEAPHSRRMKAERRAHVPVPPTPLFGEAVS